MQLGSVSGIIEHARGVGATVEAAPFRFVVWYTAVEGASNALGLVHGFRFVSPL